MPVSWTGLIPAADGSSLALQQSFSSRTRALSAFVSRVSKCIIFPITLVLCHLQLPKQLEQQVRSRLRFPILQRCDVLRSGFQWTGQQDRVEKPFTFISIWGKQPHFIQSSHEPYSAPVQLEKMKQLPLYTLGGAQTDGFNMLLLIEAAGLMSKPRRLTQHRLPPDSPEGFHNGVFTSWVK